MYRFVYHHENGNINSMNTVSQNSPINTRVNSQSSKKSSAIEKLGDYQRDKIPADKKKGTPATKQAKRDKKSKEEWKNKATQRACDINATCTQIHGKFNQRLTALRLRRGKCSK